MITVVLPTYNRASYLQKTIESVLEQSFKEFELIIVDDGSNDNTNEVIDGFKDERLKYIRYDKNRGACYARNLGVEEAQYPIIAFQDSDDLWENNYLEEQWKEFKKVKIQYAAQICRYRFKFDNEIKIAPSEADVERGVNIHQLFKYNIVSTQILMVKKSALLDVGGFDESLPAFQDWDLAIRLLLNNHKINILNKILVNVQVTENSISRNREKRLEAIDRIYNKNLDYFEESEFDKYSFSYTAFKMYKNYKKERKQKWKYFKNCIFEQPFRIDNIKIILVALNIWGNK